MFYRPTPSSDWLAGSRWWGGIEEGLSLRAAAAALSVSPATAHRWWRRWLDGGRRPELWLTARAVRFARRGFLPRSCRSGSAPVDARRAGDRGW
jgi:Homeodomain-like domain